MTLRPDLDPAAWIATPITAGLVRGALELERTDDGVLPHRLPARARAQCTDTQLALAEAQPSGVRLALRTAATVIELAARPTKTVYQGGPARPDGVYDLLVDGRLAAQGGVAAGNVLTVDLANGSAVTAPGPAGTVRFGGLPPGVKNVEIWLPHREITELLGLRADAPIEPQPGRGRRAWLHHGGSISHGADAASPTATWPAVAAARAGVELTNLGLGGGGVLDPFTARALRDAPADLISVKVGVDVVNADLMRARVFGPAVHGFLDTIREGHPDTPLVVVSPLLCPMHEETPGPCAAEFHDGRVHLRALGDPVDRAAGKLTLQLIRAELARIVAARCADDPALRYLDGRELYGEADAAELPLPDRLHPGTEAHRRIGERFAALALS